MRVGEGKWIKDLNGKEFHLLVIDMDYRKYKQMKSGKDCNSQSAACV